MTVANRKPAGLPPVTEAEFTRQVLAMAYVFGWRSAHFRPARTADGWRTAVQGDGKGFPDVFAAHPKRGWVIAAELKVGRNKLTPAQADWIATLEAVGIATYLWTEKDWEDIESVLRDGPRKQGNST